MLRRRLDGVGQGRIGGKSRENFFVYNEFSPNDGRLTGSWRVLASIIVMEIEFFRLVYRALFESNVSCQGQMVGLGRMVY